MNDIPQSPVTSRASARGRNRSKTSSSLAGMLSLEDAISASREQAANGLNDSDRNELSSMSRSLRRAKRKLLLKAVEEPTKPVDQLRELLLQLSLDTLDCYDDESFEFLPRARGASVAE